MPILFMALIALAVFGAIGILLGVACFSEHRQLRAQAAAAPPAPGPKPKTRAAARS
jgi:hypothetical protein